MIRDALPPTDDPHAAASATAHLLEELHLYGIRPFQDEPDPRPMPDAETAESAVTACLETLAHLFTGTRLEDDLGDLLWSVVNAFHRRVGALDRALDTNEQAQRRAQAEQDGSEVRSVELERLTGVSWFGRALARRVFGRAQARVSFFSAAPARRGASAGSTAAMPPGPQGPLVENLAFRDTAAEAFEAITGGAWRPRAGSLTNRRALTAAVIDSRDFLAARQRVETQVMLPPGPRVAFAGGPACTDHRRIWAVLDKVRGRHPDMVLLHGGAPKGAERIAACWADQRGVPQIVFRPDWTRHGKAAPFRRNEHLLESLPIGVIVFPGSGITDNLADTARRMGIPVWKIGPEGGA